MASEMIRRSTINKVLEMMEEVSGSFKDMGIGDHGYAKGYQRAINLFRSELGFRDEHPEDEDVN